MTRLIPMCGLPRSGSTLLVNLLNQHPDIFASPDSLLSSQLISARDHLSSTIMHSQYNSDLSYELFHNFCKYGSYSWMKTLTDKEVFLDKSRQWIHVFDLVDNIFPETKFIFCIRDLRGMYSSMLKAQKKTAIQYKHDYLLGDQDYDYRKENIENIKLEKLFDFSMINGVLIVIKELLDCRMLNENQLFIRYEDLVTNPRTTLNSIYDFLGLKKINNNLDNIDQIPYNDCTFLPYGNHKIKNRLVEFDPWKFNISEEIEEKIIQDNDWYYAEFYPDAI